MIVVHRRKLVASRGHSAVRMLAHLRVEMTANSSCVAACDRAFELLTTLALTNKVAQGCLLLARAILAISD